MPRDRFLSAPPSPCWCPRCCRMLILDLRTCGRWLFGRWVRRTFAARIVGSETRRSRCAWLGLSSLLIICYFAAWVTLRVFVMYWVTLKCSCLGREYYCFGFGFMCTFYLFNSVHWSISTLTFSVHLNVICCSLFAWVIQGVFYFMSIKLIFVWSFVIFILLTFNFPLLKR